MTTLILPICLFAVCAALLAGGMLAAGTLLGPRRQGAVKQMPYESGMDPIHDTRRKFDVRFHLVAIAFLMFDVEVLFLYPWATAAGNQEHGITAVVAEAQAAGFTDFTRLLVFADVMVFMLLLTAGFVYAWRRGVFRWR
ncbi:NADH-quinone oxidoreductase subunit A [Lignipirellula cremea]|uniref:NADH-quinone oxidoreductase subunit A n=1 Tax=Lignipirellula cremea TaxID=2528010 RepID=A0A518DQV7_9BACT|nr:NADH-quinone oxidoreductase subunit A [Lignipirellula cremea]QDU94204.1 NAD(P)H-quinone oxidoreductase subunit 3 [Lignipirellula cremea]